MNLKELREKNHLTQGDLAELIGVQKSCIGNYEQGTRHPRPKVAERISDLFNLTDKERWDMFYASRESEVITIGRNRTMPYREASCGDSSSR